MTKLKPPTLDAIRKAAHSKGTGGVWFSPLVVEHLGQRKGDVWYRLAEPLVMVIHVNGGEPITIAVPVGFETNFASIPRLLQWRFRADGPWADAAVVHDYLYGAGKCSRFFADAVFRDGMAALGVRRWDYLVMYYAVRCSSKAWKAWKKGTH